MFLIYFFTLIYIEIVYFVKTGLRTKSNVVIIFKVMPGSNAVPKAVVYNVDYKSL